MLSFVHPGCLIGDKVLHYSDSGKGLERVHGFEDADVNENSLEVPAVLLTICRCAQSAASPEVLHHMLVQHTRLACHRVAASPHQP